MAFLGKESGIIGAASVLVIATLLAYFLFTHSPSTEPLWQSATSTEAVRDIYSYVPNPNSTLIRFQEGVQAWYTNERLNFSFRLPEGFTAPDGTLKDSKGQVVTLSNGSGDDLLLLALPITSGADRKLTEDLVKENSPNQNLSDFRERTLKDGTRGLEFRTDSNDWNGSGIAFWFIKDGYLYELTTYEKDAELLELVVGTLHFAKPVPPPPNLKQ